MTKIILDDQLVSGTIASATIAAAMPLIAPRRRARLNSGCAVAALLSLPGAMSVGIMLARPAQAQTNISSNKSSTVILGNTTNYPSGNPFTISSGTTVNAPTGDGVYGNVGTQWTLTNYGVVIGGTANGVGFSSGGTISNSASGGVAGTIIGATDGVYTTGTLGTVNNTGLIHGSANSGIEMLAGGYIGNSFYITLLGSIISDHPGTISGGDDGVKIQNAAANILNYGNIIGAAGDGVNNQAGGNVANELDTAVISGAQIGVHFTSAYGSVHNYGTIAGGTIGVDFVHAGSIYNGGTISGGTYGVNLGNAGAHITNAAGGYITGAHTGVTMDDANDTVVNDALISATGMGGVAVYGNADTVSNDGNLIGDAAGVSLTAGGVVFNYGKGVISGVGGVGISDLGSGTATIYNAGTISGTNIAVGVAAGGSVVNYGGSISGNVDGISISGDSIYITNSGAGFITGGTNGVVATSYGTLLNTGTIAGGSIGVAFTDGGTIFSGESISGGLYGISISGGPANITAGAGGFISGGNAGVITTGTIAYVLDSESDIAGYTGVYLRGGGTLKNINSGLITGSSSYGVQIGYIGNSAANAGTIINRASINGSLEGAFLGAGGSVNNYGQITGGVYGVSIAGGAGSVLNGGIFGLTARAISAAPAPASSSAPVMRLSKMDPRSWTFWRAAPSSAAATA